MKWSDGVFLLQKTARGETSDTELALSVADACFYPGDPSNGQWLLQKSYQWHNSPMAAPAWSLPYPPGGFRRSLLPQPYHLAAVVWKSAIPKPRGKRELLGPRNDKEQSTERNLSTSNRPCSPHQRISLKQKRSGSGRDLVYNQEAVTLRA